MPVRLDAHLDEQHRDQQWHKPVRVATTANVTISTALNNGDTIDGVTLATGDRVLVKSQSSGAENGIYIVGTSPARAYDFLAGIQAMGAFVYVIAGTANGGKVYYNTNTTLPTIGSTALTFTALSSGGSAITVKDEGSTLTSALTSLDFVGAGVTATNSSGDVTVTISGSGSSSDDTIPSGGTLYNGTSTSGWTTFGSPDTFDADTTVPGAFYLREATFGTNNLIGAYRATSSFPRTYTMRIKDAMMHADFQGVNILVAEASPGKFWTWGYVRDGISNKYHQRYAWTTAAASGTNQNFNGGVNIASPAQWYRIVVNSSTDIELWHSYNGFIYYRYAASQNPSFTIGNFGFGMYTFSAIEMKAAIDWIHES